MSYIDKIKKLYNGKLPKTFSLWMKYGEFLPSEKEEAAQSFFSVLMTDKDDKKKAKRLGLI
ncbi:MAG: hypothetical protein LC105_05495 [Chitinophagales bacterium]|nr:hypothetical protein [Chitinophagales bacterium]MCZ2393289.1 hypothetical protein [Chitinophagales bacterium]